MFKDIVQGELNVAKRDGRVVAFESGLISKAIQKAFGAEQGIDNPADLEAGLLEKIGHDECVGRRAGKRRCCGNGECDGRAYSGFGRTRTDEK